MAEYFLQVELIVPAANADTFEKKVGELLDRAKAEGFERAKPFKFFDSSFDIELVMALKTAAAFKFSGYESYQSVKGQFEMFDRRKGMMESVYRYVHLWRLNDLSELDIARVMTRSADDVLYAEIDAQVLRETQNLVLRVQWLNGQPTMDVGKGRFVRVVRHFKSKDLGTYLFKVGALFPLLAQNNYRTLGHFQNVTSELDTVTEFWQTPEDEKLATMLHVFDNVSPGFREQIVNDFEKLCQAEVRESFVRAPYFP
jgi:hypothetical protein